MDFPAKKKDEQDLKCNIIFSKQSPPSPKSKFLCGRFKERELLNWKNYEEIPCTRRKCPPCCGHCHQINITVWFMEMYAQAKWEEPSTCTKHPCWFPEAAQNKIAAILSTLSFTSHITQLLSSNRLRTPKCSLLAIKQDQEKEALNKAFCGEHCESHRRASAHLHARHMYLVSISFNASSHHHKAGRPDTWLKGKVSDKPISVLRQWNTSTQAQHFAPFRA